MKKIEMVDLRSQYERYKADIDSAISGVISSTAFIKGPDVRLFEEELQRYLGVRHVIACANGTDALKLGLMAAGVGGGDEVITVPNTFIATTEAINLAGASFGFVDIDRETYNLSPGKLAEFLERQCRVKDGHCVNTKTGRRVKAVLPVHLYGLPVDLGPILELAEKYRFQVIEDACQAQIGISRGRGHLAGTRTGIIANEDIYQIQNDYLKSGRRGRLPDTCEGCPPNKETVYCKIHF